ncbi:MAG: 4-hydroxythreonine-4-phosphate dehydrogenase PdxA [Chitinophagales bacterium]|nr:4-hydroxythreonine-4-phosphate dehydrogenase PdxA [Chitinophagales bacterium]
MREDKLRVGISIGDIAGIGPEVIMKTFIDDRMFKLFTPILFGNAKVLSFYKKELNIDKIQYNTVKSIQQLSHNSLNIVQVWDEDVEIKPGKPDKKTGELALKSLQGAVQALKDGDIDVLVTAPINKNYIHSAEFPFSGHTSYLEKEFGDHQSLMFMVSENLRVGLVTEHVPVKEISEHISKEAIVKKLGLIERSLIEDFGIDRPKIAVLGLNPHKGDDGLLGTEEIDIITPAIKEVREKETLVFGPYSADGFFAKETYKLFDATLAMYHDQGLIPFKSLCVGSGTNYTAGLSIVRTSPDHGTAENIAGKDKADESSFRDAIFCAIDIYRNREDYKERNADPLVRRANLRDEKY